ncbi:MAG: acetolactate synthase [Planctomycetaceae bacterium]|nr:acetolactate synthase [Planctomycetaceae bacterium]
MSSSFGEDVPVEPITSRGRDWPCLRQFVVFLENRVGSLHEVLKRIERDDLKIVALSIVDSTDCAVARIIVNNYERAHELLTFGGVTMFETDVIGVLLPETDQPHTSVLGSLMSAELNVQYVYPLMYRKGGRGAVAIYPSEMDEALRVLKEREYQLVTEDDLLGYDEFF